METTASPPVGSPTRSGAAGMRGMVKHSILNNPKETGILIAVLVIAIIALAFFFYKCHKDASAIKSGFDSYRPQGGSMYSNHDNGSNSPKWAGGEQTGPISSPDGQYTPGAGFSYGNPASTVDMAVNTASIQAVQMRLGSDPYSATDVIDGNVALGSVCSGSAASARAVSEQAAQHALNGGAFYDQLVARGQIKAM